MTLDINPRSLADRLADVLLEHASIEDCHVVVRRGSRATESLVAYVVTSGRLDRDELAALVRNAGLPEPLLAPVAALPRRVDGAVDDVALRDVPVLTADLLQDWERQLSTVAGVREAAALITPYRPATRAVHLAELFPDWQRVPDRGTAQPAVDRSAAADAAPVAPAEAVPAIVDNPEVAMPASDPRTLAEALLRAADTRKEPGITHVAADNSERQQTYAELLEDARRIVGGLRARGLRPGQPVLLQLAASDDFIPVFWACQLGGFVPVPVGIAPSYSQSNATLGKLRHAWQLLSFPPIVASPELTAPLDALGREWALDQWNPIGVDALRSHAPDAALHPSAPDDLALLLLTSGSTGTPKAVMQSHRALLSRSFAACEADGFTRDDVWLNWLPLDHVGGLVMCHIGSVYAGGRYVHAPAAYVLEKPLRWLELIDRHRATATWAPNFAYALVNAQADALETRRFDLSSMRYIINGGEAVVAKTARRFLEILEPHGLPAAAMRPAWGMSETCSAVASSGVFTRATTSDADVFVSVGPPLPGVAFRIADAMDAVVPEGVVGRFQVKGRAVTSGYFGQPDVSAQSFTRDGWFTTGDLAFIRDGQLTIAGRQKDDIIINGVNFYCQDIESHVEEVAGVAVSFTAACAVRLPGRETDELAIMFSPTASDDAALARVLSEIRGKVVAELGVNPTYLIPLEPGAIPKTEIGKIQRARLRQQLESGEFENVLRRVDVLLETAATVPDWCVQPVWQRQPARSSIAADGATLLLASEQASTSDWASILRSAGPVVQVTAARRFARRDAFRYEIDPDSPEHYRDLLASCERDGVDIARVVHAWSFAPHDGRLPTAETATAAAASGAAGLTALGRALADRNLRGARLVVVSACAQQVHETEPLAAERTVLAPLVRAIAAEHPALHCTHVDLPLDATAAESVRAELTARAEPEVAYREGVRWVRRLRHLDLTGETPVLPAFTAGGVYAITGALGGVGWTLAAHLLRTYRARLLLMGRAPAAERDAQLDTLRRLAAETGGDVHYVQVEIEDTASLAAAFDDAAARWGAVNGVLHLAGAYHDRSVTDEDRESLTRILSPKAGGACALAEVLGRRHAWFVGFSTALSFFGGAMVGGYAAANRYLESVSAVLRQQGRRSCTLAWSTWDQTGMSRGHAGATALRARGFRAMAPAQAMHSLVAALDRGVANAIVGVDPRNAFIRRQLVGTPPAVEQLTAFVAADDPSRAGAAIREHAPRDGFGTSVTFDVIDLPSLPRAADGSVDRARLLAASQQREYVAPQTDRERVVAAIWQEVLGGSMPGIHDNFFESGGHSLLAAQVLARVKTECGIELPLRTLFEAPTIQALARRLDEVSATDAVAAPEAGAAAGPRQLSYAQQRLWFLDRLEPDSTAYNIPIAFWIQGPLEADALDASLAAIVDRHETLRTRFPDVDGLPAQVVDAESRVRLERIDLTGAAAGDRDRVGRQYASADAQRPFNLADGPLLRVTLLAFDRDVHALLVTFHHIIADGWSLGVFSRELSAAYEAVVAGATPSLPPLPMQYADYAAWQRRMVEGERLQRELAYWTAALDGVPTVIALPADRQRPAVQTSRGTHRSFSLPSDVVERLHDMSRREAVTPFMTLLAAFETLLHRYSAQEEFIVSTAVANRDLPETEPLIGCLINVLPMRADASGDPTFAEMVARVRESSLQAFAHQQLPFERLVEALHPDRDLGYNPLTQVMFVYLPEPPARLSLDGLDVRSFDVADAATPYDVQLHLWPDGNGLHGVLHYSTDLFDDATIDRMVAQFGVLLKAAVASPHERIKRLPLLSAADTQQLIESWNRTERAYASDRTVHQLVDAQAERTPDAVAVVDAERELTYAELRRRSNQVARHLRARGVGPDVLVGIAMDRTADLLVGLLGILKAGGAYVPLDPSYPAERLQYMLEDSQSPVLVTSRRILATLPVTPASAVCMDGDWAAIATESADDLAPAARPENLAYVIYTSGSTGQPKGVEIPHRALTNFLMSMQALPGITAADRLLAVTTLSFDIAGLEIYLPLIAGATLVVASREIATDAFALMKELRARRITMMQATPATWQALVQAGWTGDSGLKALCGGEAVSRQLADDLVDRCGEVWNMYGPTETTIWSTLLRLTHRGQPITIGRPIANTTTYVLDAVQQPAPIGVPGELHIGGDGLARGYRHRPDLTDEKFIRHPFRAGERLYRTGDLVRYLPTGEIEFLGRLDHQVKIHGHRIELGEIEGVLSQHPSIREVVATVRGDGRDKRLVAYVAFGDGERPSTVQLQRWVRDHLPAYMVPSAFVRLDALPRTLNGKIDRKKLPAPEMERGDVGQALVAPRNELEESLAAIWRDVIGIAEVGVYDDFFAVGGHSLLATQVLARVKARWHVELPVRALFETPTIAGLATQLAAGTTRSEPPLVAVSRDRDLPLSFAQQRFWFIDQLDPGTTSYNIPCAFRIKGPLDVDALERSLAAIVARHESLRTRFPSVDGQPRQVIAPAGLAPLVVVDLSAVPPSDREADARKRATAEARRPFDLAAGPLVRTTLMRLDAGDHLLAVTMHHIVTDGWSLEVFTDELRELYEAFAAGAPSPLAPLPLQYADFAVWQRALLDADRLSAHLGYWKSHLEGLPTLVNLPMDRPRPPVQTFRGGELRFTLPPDLSGRLRQVSRQEGVSLFMTLMTVFQALLHRYSGQERFIVSTGVANRARPEIERLIGCLINVVLLKADLADNPDWRTLLQRVREEALASYAHQDLPFEKLVEELQPERDLSYNPLAQVMFVLLRAPLDRLELPGLDVESFGVDTVSSPYDLVLHAWETDERLEGFWHFNADIFDRATIERLMGHFETLLGSLTSALETTVLDAPMLSRAEAQQMLVEWNATGQPFPDDTCLHELFEQQVARAPDAVAVLFDDESLTYGELDRRANQLAHYLRRRGVGPDVPVGISVERSIEMVVGILGILKAGGAYVPLDPAYPEARLRMMLEDSRAGVLLTQEHLRATLPDTGADTISIDAAWPEIANESGTKPESGVTCRNLSYVIYTSGSTGAPKGIAIEHRGVVNNLVDLNWRHDVNAADRVLALSSLSFDMCVYEVLGTLEAGGAIVVPTPAQWREPAAWAALVKRHNVSVWNSAPALLKMYVDYVADRPELWPVHVHVAILGGDWVPVSLPDRLKAMAPRVRVIVLGGATEASIHSTIYEVTRTDPSWKSIPYGRPMYNQKTYVLNARLQPNPIGVPGELFLGGIGLGRGYYRRPEQTAERFLPSPFVAGERIYRTGDLARYRADGNLELIGRMDHQVKLRGLRIECGEIEAVIRRHPAVREAVVVAQDHGTGDKRLVAYIRPNEAAAGPVARLLAMQASGALDGLHTQVLPNGMTVVCRNKAETEFGYEEIFEDDDYESYGIELHDGDCVFDVGANIGLFSLKLWRKYPELRIHAFEPVGPVFQVLDANATIYGIRGRMTNCGLAAASGVEELTYYPHLSLISGRFADAASEREVVKGYLLNQKGAEANAALDEVLSESLRSERLSCRMATLSEIIREQGVDRIDLLKIDTERGELDVLAGIEEADWSKIGQLIVEVYNSGDRLQTVTTMLERRGYRVAVEQHPVLAEAPFVNVYAARPDVQRRSEIAPATERVSTPMAWASESGLLEDVREFVRGKLPDYMVPAGFVLLNQLPLSPNGKIDRKSLSAMAVTVAGSGAAVAPEGQVQEAIAAIVQSVLGIERVGASDNFFDIGGHSLLAAQVVAQIRKAFGVDLPLRTIFEAPTVAQLADVVSAQSGEQRSALAMPDLRPAPRDRALRLSSAQESLWFMQSLVPESTAYNIAPILRITGSVDEDALERALRSLITRHEILRTTFTERDGHPAQVVGPVPARVLERDDLRRLPRAARELEANRLADAEAVHRFDLAAGPLVRARLITLDDTERLLTLTFHHTVVDGWSLDVLARDLGAFYEAEITRRSPSVSPLPVQFADFAEWEQDWMSNGARDALTAFWTDALAGAPPFVELPIDRPRPAAQTLRGARYYFRWSDATAARLDDICRTERLSPFMATLAAFSVMISASASTDDVIVGSPFANRAQQETHGLIGPFVHTLPIRTKVERGMSFRALAERVRDTVLAVEAHQGLSLDRIVEAIKPPRDASRNPIFQINFRCLAAPLFSTTLPGLTTALRVSDAVTSKFDLALELCPTADGVQGFFEYSTDLFDEATIRRIASQFERLVISLLSAPDQPIGDAAAVSEIETASSRGRTPLAAAPEKRLRAVKRRGIDVT